MTMGLQNSFARSVAAEIEITNRKLILALPGYRDKTLNPSLRACQGYD